MASVPSRICLASLITQQSLHRADLHQHTAHSPRHSAAPSPCPLPPLLFSPHSNRFIALMSAITLREHPGSTIVTDSVTSNGLTDFITKLGGKHLR